VSYVSLISVEIVLRKHELLKDILCSRLASAFHPAVSAGLKSQATFAAFCSPEIAIYPISLNNLKTTANQIIDGGFHYLDAMRKEALAQLDLREDIPPLPRADNKSELTTRVKSLKRQLVQLQEHNMRLTYIICEIQSRYQSIALIPPSAVKERHALDMNEIYSILSGLNIVLEGS
jgi:hypothetical protein